MRMAVVVNMGLMAFLAVLVANGMEAGEVFEPKSYVSSNGESLKYRIHLPAPMEEGERYPLALFLHGAGERGDDNRIQLRYGPPALLEYALESEDPAIIVAPQCPKEKKWVDTPWDGEAHSMPVKPSQPMRLTIELLEKLISELPVDRDRVYVTGLSMGGFGTWDIIQRRPELFAAAIPICGGGDTAKAENIKDIPIRIFHGRDDETVLPERSRQMLAALEKVGANVEYTEYQGVGHDSWTRTYSDPAVMRWLFEQRKSEPGVHGE